MGGRGPRPLNRSSASSTKVRTRLADRGLELILSDEAKEFIIDKGYNPDYGARPLRRAIENMVEDPLAEEILRGSFKGKNVIKKTPGAIKWGDIQLKRGFTDDMALYEWRQKVVDGKLEDARKNGSVVVYDYENEEVLRWNFINGWLSKYQGPSLNASGNDIAIESITIVHEGLKRIK